MRLEPLLGVPKESATPMPMKCCESLSVHSSNLEAAANISRPKKTWQPFQYSAHRHRHGTVDSLLQRRAYHRRGRVERAGSPNAKYMTERHGKME
jgi:hypothetical protein